MFIEVCQRHLGVCSYNDLPRFAKSDPGFWNVISLLEPSFPKLALRGFRKIHHARLYDVIGLEGLEGDSGLGIPRAEHLKDIFRFADSVPGEPLLVHCRAGISRSTGVALCLIVRALHQRGDSSKLIAEQAPEIILQIRPQAAPNPLILELGFAEFLSAADARDLVVKLVNHPRLLENRFLGGSKR